MALMQRFRRGVTWNVMGTLGGQGTIFLTNIGLANLLGKETFGEYAFLNSTLLALGSVAQLGTGLTVTKYVAEFRSSDPERAGRILGVCRTLTLVTGLGGALLLFVGARWLATVILEQPDLVMAVRIAAGYVWFAVMVGVQNGALSGLERYHVSARATALHAPLHLAICLFAAWRWGLTGAAAGLATSAFLRWLIFEYFLRAELPRAGVQRRTGLAHGESAVIGHFALPAALSGLSAMPARWAASAFLIGIPGGHGEMAIYAAANNLRNLVVFLPGLINAVGLSLLNNAKGNMHAANYRHVFWNNLTITCGTTAVGAAVVALLGGPLLGLYGTGFRSGYEVLLLMLLAAVLDGTGLGVYQIIQAQERMWVSLFAVALPRDLLLLGLGYALIAPYGALGLAMAFAASSALALLATCWVVYRLGLDTAGNRGMVRDVV